MWPATFRHMWTEPFAAEWCTVATCSAAQGGRGNADDGITVRAVLMAGNCAAKRSGV
jgi:hypothetical protein